MKKIALTLMMMLIAMSCFSATRTDVIFPNYDLGQSLEWVTGFGFTVAAVMSASYFIIDHSLTQNSNLTADDGACIMLSMAASFIAVECFYLANNSGKVDTSQPIPADVYKTTVRIFDVPIFKF